MSQPVKFDEKTIKRFWNKVDKNGLLIPGMATRCWSWKAYINHDGYGTLDYLGDTRTAHRFSYMLHIGPIPDDMEVRHICHNAICCNPDHLVLGSHIDNMRDLARSGRRKGFRVKAHRPPKYRPTLEERFLAKVDKDGPVLIHMDTPCWIWLAHRDNRGYGRFSYNGVLKLAHRCSWIIYRGPISDNLDVLHSCDNPTCVNPDHLAIGTHQKNMQDMVKRGRHKTRKGESNNQAKLTQSQVNEIRSRSATTTQVQLAKEYGVTQAAIWYILKNRNWKV